MRINIKKLTETAKTPTRGSEYAAGYDLYAAIYSGEVPEGKYIPSASVLPKEVVWADNEQRKYCKKLIEDIDIDLTYVPFTVVGLILIIFLTNAFKFANKSSSEKETLPIIP